jgi:hypothetical protein
MAACCHATHVLAPFTRQLITERHSGRAHAFIISRIERLRQSIQDVGPAVSACDTQRRVVLARVTLCSLLPTHRQSEIASQDERIEVSFEPFLECIHVGPLDLGIVEERETLVVQEAGLLQVLEVEADPESDVGQPRRQRSAIEKRRNAARVSGRCWRDAGTRAGAQEASSRQAPGAKSIFARSRAAEGTRT